MMLSLARFSFYQHHSHIYPLKYTMKISPRWQFLHFILWIKLETIINFRHVEICRLNFVIAGDRIWFQNDPCDVSDFLNMNSCRNGNETFVHGRFLLEILIWKGTKLLRHLATERMALLWKQSTFKTRRKSPLRRWKRSFTLGKNAWH